MTSPATDFQALQPGLEGKVQLVVSEEHTAQHLGSGAVRVLATPQLVLLMERASVAAVDPLLPEGYRTVGAHLDVQHLAPTPIGFKVMALAELVEVQGRRLTFHVQVYEEPLDQTQDEGELVGDGTHQRVIINVQRFSERIAQKGIKT